MPGGRPILFPFNLAILMPSLVLSLRPLISISANMGLLAHFTQIYRLVLI